MLVLVVGRRRLRRERRCSYPHPLAPSNFGQRFAPKIPTAPFKLSQCACVRVQGRQHFLLRSGGSNPRSGVLETGGSREERISRDVGRRATLRWEAVADWVMRPLHLLSRTLLGLNQPSNFSANRWISRLKQLKQLRRVYRRLATLGIDDSHTFKASNASLATSWPSARYLT